MGKLDPRVPRMPSQHDAAYDGLNVGKTNSYPEVLALMQKLNSTFDSRDNRSPAMAADNYRIEVRGIRRC